MRILLAFTMLIGPTACWQELRAQVEACIPATISDAGVVCLPADQAGPDIPVEDLCGVRLVSVDDGPVLATRKSPGTADATPSVCCYLVTEDFPTLGFCE